MVDCSAIRVSSAGSGARIPTLVVQTGLRPVAIGADNALRSTTGVGIAEVLGETTARSGSVSFFADCVSTARRRIAGPFWTFRREN